MKGRQFPIVRNSGTTGHKLQGRTVVNIFILGWKYQMNCPYVVLSRVTTMDGVYLQEKLDEDLSHYAVPESLTRMPPGLAWWKLNILTTQTTTIFSQTKIK